MIRACSLRAPKCPASGGNAVCGGVKDRPLEIASVATGGSYQSVVRDRTLEKAVDSIGGELNSQYLLSYHPTGTDAEGYHQIKVTVDRPGVKVRTRPGYYLEGK